MPPPRQISYNRRHQPATTVPRLAEADPAATIKTELIIYHGSFRWDCNADCSAAVPDIAAVTEGT